MKADGKQTDNHTVLRVLKQQNRTEVEGEQTLRTTPTSVSLITTCPTNNAKADMALRAGPDYDAYLDSMLAHLGRVQRGAAIRYFVRRLEEARAA